MHKVFNVITGEEMPAQADVPYELSGPLGERIMVQKTDEQGSPLYIDTLTGGETTEECFETVTDETESISIPRPPVRVDGGPLYEWREVVPTGADLLASAKAAKLAKIRELIAATDYKCLKFVDGALTEAEYAETKAYREALRDAYNAVEAADTVAAVEAVAV